MMKSLFVLSTWDTIFPNEQPDKTYDGEIINPTISRISNPSYSKVYVKSCVFSEIASRDYGGAIRIQKSAQLLVDSSLFLSVTTSASDGGALYFYNTGNGQCMINKICSFACCSTNSDTSWGQFCYVFVKNEENAVNGFEYSSIVHSKPEGSNSFHTLYLYNGNISISRDNISYNKCHCWTAFRITPFVSSITTCHVLLSSITNNTALSDRVICFDSDGRNEMLQTNVINNTSPTYIFDVYGYITVMNTCIVNNKAPTLFFSYFGLHITVFNSTIDYWNCNTDLEYQQNVNPSFIIGVNLLNTAKCEAKQDSFDKLLPSFPEGENQSNRKRTMAYNSQYLLTLCHNLMFLSAIIILSPLI